MNQPRKIKQYEESLSYQGIMRDLEENDLDSVFSRIFPIVDIKLKTKVISLLEILKEAYDDGDKSDEFIETLTGAIRLYYQEMCNEGLIQRIFEGTVTSIAPEE